MRRVSLLFGLLLPALLTLGACETLTVDSFDGPGTAHHIASNDTLAGIEEALEAGALDLAARRVDRARLAGLEGAELDRLTGALLLARGEPGAAATILARVPTDGPSGEDAAALRVRALAAAGQCEAALSVLAAIPGRETSDWRLLSIRGVCAAEAGQFEAAKAAHKASLAVIEDSGGDRALVLTNLGYASLLSGDRAAARAAFAEAQTALEAAERGPRDPVAQKLAGNRELLAALEAATEPNVPLQGADS